MSFPQGIAFRQSTGFVTDGANDYGEITSGSNNYPTTSTQGNTVGWESGRQAGAIDRSNAIDVRLAGINYQPSGLGTYRIDLPATGDYNVRLATGDFSGGGGSQTTLKDNTTAFVGPISHAAASDTFYDAGDNLRSSSTWPGNNVSVARTFGSTIFRIDVDGATRANAAIAYVYIEAAAGGGTSISATSGVANWAGQAATITTDTAISASTGNALWQGLAASISIDTAISATNGIANWAGLVATVTISSGNTDIQAATGVAIWTGLAANVTAPGGGGFHQYRVFRSGRHVTYGGGF